MRKSLFIPAVILGKIALIFLILYFNVGMFGFDSYIHLQYVDSIIENGEIVEIDIAASYYDFVGLHVLSSAITLLTGLKTEIIYEFVSIVIPILLFDLSVIAFIRHVEKKRRGYITNDFNLQYLAVVLLYPAIIGIQMFIGRPNSLGIGLFSLCLYLYLCKPERFRAQILAGFLAIATMKVHHLSAIFLLPVIFFTSIFFAINYKAILSLVYTVPAVLIVRTILNSREFNIVNLYFSRNEVYATLYNVFIKNTFSLLVLWLIITMIGYLIRRRYGKRISAFFSTHKVAKLSILSLVGIILIAEVIGLFIYTANLQSWYISVELVIIFILSGVALLFPDSVKYALFALGFSFYGFTVVFSLAFSSAEHELSWVAPRTFVFTIIFVSLLGYLAISGLFGWLSKKWKTLIIATLLFNSYLSFAYMGEQYLPGYNLTNDYQNLTFANNIEGYVNLTLYSSRISIPFSISKFIDGINIYGLPLLIDSNSSLAENANRLRWTSLYYIVIGNVMDQWLGTPIYLSQSEITYYLGLLIGTRPTFHVVMSNSKNFLLYHF
ncbi:MAG: hypothetical protein KAS63_00275 [Candidatus Heimdallarchaeota archaeon]|nr:hypothetical protein [Candidatus Heimdallarchaeota archaeon]MCK4953778.1 hypothetical protein [Candidatus Heimdallarchaeota archaeon]